MLVEKKGQLLRTQVYDHLRQMLVTGTLKPGDFISCNKIAAELQVGRTPLRDALLQLQSDGFVTFYPQRGVQVREFSLGELVKLYEVCGALDAQALLLGFPRMDASVLEAMEQCNRRMRECCTQGDNIAFVRHNIAFHDMYLHLCDNEILNGLLTTMRQRLFEFSWDGWHGQWGRSWREQNHQEHEDLIALLRNGNVKDAAEYLRTVHWSYNW